MAEDKRRESEHFIHPIAPLFNSKSKVLILGTFPSPKSREGKFFYNHPHNRFWKVIAAITKSTVPENIQQKKKMILDNNFALWDVIASCHIIGAKDSSIKDVVPSDLDVIFNHAAIEKVFANGGTAYRLYMKHCYPVFGYPIIQLPSTSPANASWSLERLTAAWEVIVR